MQPVSSVSLFCEDIREEKSGQDTIIGIFPDNIEVPHLPGMMPRLGVYLRTHFSVEKMPKTVSGKLVNPDGSAIPFKEWGADTMAQSFSDSRKNNSPLVGLVMKLVAGPYPIPKAGKVIAIIIVDGEEYIAGMLNVIVSPNASPRRASQSQNVAPATA